MQEKQVYNSGDISLTCEEMKARIADNMSLLYRTNSIMIYNKNKSMVIFIKNQECYVRIETFFKSMDKNKLTN